MTTPITDRDLPEEIMASMMRLEEEAYRAGQHGCCEEGVAKMANPSCFGACPAHGPRSRSALSLLCHALAQWAERIVEEAAKMAEEHNAATAAVAPQIRALAPRCPKCHGWGYSVPEDGAYCDCSRGKAYRHWDILSPSPASTPSAQEAPAAPDEEKGEACPECGGVGEGGEYVMVNEVADWQSYPCPKCHGTGRAPGKGGGT